MTTTNKVTAKHWTPIPSIILKMVSYCKKKGYENILEIGPGKSPFPLATRFVGNNEKVDDFIQLDIDEEKLPFGEKELDFIYCRHVLEDIQNPNFAIKEMIRCAKSGYAETPSPLVEVTKGVDGGQISELYSGYHHHRYIVWSDIEKNEIYFLPKYSNIIDPFWKTPAEGYKLLENPIYWNNYFLWDEMNPPKIIVYKNGINMGLEKGLINDYIELCKVAINKSIANTNFFISTILKDL